MKVKLITNKDPAQFKSDLQKELDEGWFISGELSTSPIQGGTGSFVVYSILLIKS
jgi:hypothetical protein